MFDSPLTSLQSAPAPVRIVVILVLAILIHFAVRLIRRWGAMLTSSGVKTRLSRAGTLASLVTSFAVFCLYFIALGLIMKEFGLSLKAYLASASIVGLAIGFGSQGLVQDVVTGLTLVFSNLVDVGDMVEISGQTGIVRSVGMRFTVIENAMGAKVYIPNRTISNVINYPRGYIRGIADITLSDDPAKAEQMIQIVTAIASSTFERVPGILITPPSIEGRTRTSAEREHLRVKLRLWPGRGASVEAMLKPELVYALKRVDPDYQDWMIAINFEIERKMAPVVGAKIGLPKKNAAGSGGGGK